MKFGESILGINKLEKVIDEMWLTSIWDYQWYKWQGRSYLFLQPKIHNIYPRIYIPKNSFYLFK